MVFLKLLLDKFNPDSFFRESREKRFCPNCGSEDVEPDERHTNNLGEFIFDLNKWLCNECGYTGIMPLESDQGQQDIEFDPVEQEKVDTSAGTGMLKYYIKIMAPTVILAYVLFRLIYG